MFKKLRKSLRARANFARLYSLIKESGLFFQDWYVERNDDVADSGMDPVVHYIRYGAAEGRDPNPLFSTSWYTETYLDGSKDGGNPLAHYLNTGTDNGLNPHPLFHTYYYLHRNADVAKDGINPLKHFLLYGAAEKRNPCPFFDIRWYLESNPGIDLGGMNPLEHFSNFGLEGGLSPHPLFDTRWYMEAYPIVVEKKINPLVHFMDSSPGEGRRPNPLFDSSWYLQENPDVEEEGILPLQHYLEHGLEEKRDPNPLFSMEWYCSEYGHQLGEFEADPLAHYLHTGWRIGCDPHPFFANDWYLNRYQADIGGNELPPVVHFQNHWAEKKYDPHPLFDADWFLKTYPDALASGGNPVTYFESHKPGEGLQPHPLFHSEWYLDKNPDVKKAGVDPFYHFLKYGASDLRSPHPLFDADWYVNQHPGSIESGAKNPLLHFLESSADAMASPNPFFDPAWYAEEYPEVARQGVNPLVHFVKSGERNRPGPCFDPEFYLNRYPDVESSGLNPLTHYLEIGIHQGREVYDSDVFDIRPELARYIEEDITNLPRKPFFSVIVPIYNLSPDLLRLCVDSVVSQLYENWELCLCDDSSTNRETVDYLAKLDHPQISVRFQGGNGGISKATNSAIGASRGDYIVFMDHDDELTREALYYLAKTINEEEADFIYTDEQMVASNRHIIPHYKSGFNPDLLLSHNYITHLVCVSRELFGRVGELRSEYDGAQDYDFVLRATEQARKVVHIPRVLYRWREVEGSVSSNGNPRAHLNGKKALLDTLKRRGIDGTVDDGCGKYIYRVRRPVVGEPRVSIIIPFRDQPGFLGDCLQSILEKSTYSNFEVICVNNRSTLPETAELIEDFRKRDDRISFYDYDIPFNYSKINNHAASNLAKGEHLLLLNNDTSIISPDWIETLLEHSQREEVGAVGAKLYYEDGKVQHAGVILGIGGIAGHAHRFKDRGDNGYYFRLSVTHNLCAVTAAAMMVKKTIYEEAGGMNETHLTVAFNDVDFCLRLREKGYLNVYTPFCEIFHYESKSRGYEDNEEKRMRFEKEAAFMKKRHQGILAQGDPYYNCNLSLEKEDFTCSRLAQIEHKQGLDIDRLLGRHPGDSFIGKRDEKD